MADLQETVDDLAREIGRPISVEDRRWRLLAHSAHTGETDAVRRASILAREAPPEVAAWLESLGLLRAREPVAVPASDTLGMSARWCVPVRRGELLLGFLWVIVGDRPLTDAEHESLARTADAARAELWRRRSEADEHQRHVRDLLAALLDASDPAAARELAALLRWPEDARCAVALAEADGEVAERLRRRWTGGDVVWVERAPGVAVLARLRPDGLGAALREAGAVRVGVSGTFQGLAGAGAARVQAEVALVAAAARREAPGRSPEEGSAAGAAASGAGASAAGAAASGAGASAAGAAASGAGASAAGAAASGAGVSAGGAADAVVASWDELGSWGLVTSLWTGAGRPAPPPQVEALAAHRSAAELLPALEAVLDAAGDVAAAAAALHVHRATLYRRLERVEAITRLDLARGDDRLLLHLGLRLWRLAQAS